MNELEEICVLALNKYGLQKQMVKCIEELSELQKELCKYYLGEDNIRHIIEEMADVEIMIAQMKIGFNIGIFEVDQVKREKLTRLRGNIRI